MLKPDTELPTHTCSYVTVLCLEKLLNIWILAQCKVAQLCARDALGQAVNDISWKLSGSCPWATLKVAHGAQCPFGFVQSKHSQTHCFAFISVCRPARLMVRGIGIWQTLVRGKVCYAPSRSSAMCSRLIVASLRLISE